MSGREGLAERVGARLVERELVTEAELARAVEAAEARGIDLTDALVALGLVTEDQAVALMADELEVPYVFPYAGSLDRDLVGLFPEDTLRRHGVVPIGREEGRIVLAAARIADAATRQELESCCGESISFSLAAPRRIARVHDELFGPAGGAARGGPGPAPERRGEDPAAIALLYGHLARALVAGASEVRFEPQPDAIHVRYRIGKRLEERAREPLAALLSLLARAKILVGASPTDAAPRAKRIRTRIGPRDLALEVAILPTRAGESIAIRILPGERGPAEIEDMAFDEWSPEALRAVAEEERGLVLIASSDRDAARRMAYALGRVAPGFRAIVAIEEQALEPEPRFRQVEAGEGALAAALAYAPDVLILDLPLEYREVLAVLAAAEAALVIAVARAPDAVEAAIDLADSGVPGSRLARALAALVSVDGARAVAVVRPTPALRATLEGAPLPNDIRRAAREGA